MMSNIPKILFVCSRNKWRSPTAERVYQKDKRVSVKSAGLSSKSPHTLSQKDIEWADIILVMEDEHKVRIKSLFGRSETLPKIEVLNIEDEYQYMDSELIDELELSVKPFLVRLSK